MAATSETLDRKDVLLKAAFDILKQQHHASEVLNCLSLTAFYDDTDCDGHCLMEDIADHLGIDVD